LLGLIFTKTCSGSFSKKKSVKDPKNIRGCVLENKNQVGFSANQELKNLKLDEAPINLSKANFLKKKVW
jgi:hypothetical protein